MSFSERNCPVVKKSKILWFNVKTDMVFRSQQSILDL